MVVLIIFPVILQTVINLMTTKCIHTIIVFECTNVACFGRLPAQTRGLPMSTAAATHEKNI